MEATAKKYNSTNHPVFTFQSINKTEKEHKKSDKILEWLVPSEEYRGNLYKGNWLDFQFQLSGKLREQQALFKGLIHLGKPKNLQVEFDKNQSSFQLSFERRFEEEVKTYLVKIITLVEEEIRFKSLLSKIISNQERHQAEEKLLWRELKN